MKVAHSMHKTKENLENVICFYCVSIYELLTLRLQSNNGVGHLPRIVQIVGVCMRFCLVFKIMKHR